MRFSHTLKIVASGAILVLLAGCGSDGGPTAPSSLDTTAPQAPVGLRQTEIGGIQSLSWSLNSEADVVGYDVYMYSPGQGGASPYVMVGSVTDGAWRLPALGSVTYHVRARDASGNRSAASADLPTVVEAYGEISEMPDRIYPIRR